MKILILICLNIFSICVLGDTIFSDSLYHELSKNHHDTIRVNILLELGEAQNISIKERLNFTYRALELSEDNHYKKGIGMSYHLLIRHQQLDLNRMEEYGEKAILIFLELKDYEFVGKIYHGISAHYLFKGGNYLKAIEYSQKNINFCKKYGFVLDSYRSWNLIGEIYRITKNYRKALECYQNAIEVSDNPMYLSPQINMGTLHKAQGEYQKALKLYNLILDSLGNNSRSRSQGYAYILNRIGQVYLELNDFKRAKLHFDKSLNLYTELKLPKGGILVNTSLSQLYNKRGDIKKALFHGENAVENAISIGYISEDIDEVCLINARNYTKLNNYEKALYYNKIYNVVRDSLFGPEKNIAMAHNQIKLETENQAIKQQLLENQNRLDEEIIIRQHLMNSIAFAIVIFLIIIVYFLNKNFRYKSKLSKKLIEQNTEIKHQAKVLEKTNNTIKEMNTGLEKKILKRTEELETELNRVTEYSFINANHLKSPLSKILGIIYLMDHEMTITNKNTYLKKLRDAGKELDLVINSINDLLTHDRLNKENNH